MRSHAELMMRFKGSLLRGSVLLALTCCASSLQARPLVVPPATLDEALAGEVKAAELNGAALIVLGEGGELYRGVVGDVSPGANVRVASASKWVAAAVIMSVVEAAQLRLDTRVGMFCPIIPPPSLASLLAS
jgi:CubicO group peptidase (beta-lactamase class C family)